MSVKIFYWIVPRMSLPWLFSHALFAPFPTLLQNIMVHSLRPWQTRTHCGGHIVADTNVSQFAQPKKHRGQQCVRNNVSSFTRAFRFTYNCNTVKKETTATSSMTPSSAQAKYTMTAFNFKWKYEKNSRRRSRSSDYVELGHFTF